VAPPPMHANAVTATIALGANLGDATATVQQAMTDLGRLPHTRVVARSSLYQTAPVDSAGPDYINAVVEVATHLSAPELLAQLQHLEQSAGRERSYQNAPRTLDLDILLYGSATIDSLALTVPHPRMWQRAFVVHPLAEIAPQRVSDAALQAVRGQPVQKL
jgi:2-amino-4-hydroxy-6-hydroxymethyldihydropteridine diphosphokinase